MNITSFPENEYYDKNIYLIIFAAVDDHVVLIRVDELNVYESLFFRFHMQGNCLWIAYRLKI